MVLDDEEVQGKLNVTEDIMHTTMKRKLGLYSDTSVEWTTAERYKEWNEERNMKKLKNEKR